MSVGYSSYWGGSIEEIQEEYVTVCDKDIIIGHKYPKSKQPLSESDTVVLGDLYVVGKIIQCIEIEMPVGLNYRKVAQEAQKQGLYKIKVFKTKIICPQEYEKEIMAILFGLCL